MSNNVEIVFNLLFYFSLKEFRDDNDDDGSYNETYGDVLFCISVCYLKEKYLISLI